VLTVSGVDLSSRVTAKSKKQEPATALNSADSSPQLTLGVDDASARAIGAPAHAVRKQDEDTEAQWVATLVALREKLDAAHERRDRARPPRQRRPSTTVPNEPVACTTLAPVEANLLIDWRRTRDGRAWYPETELTPERILARVS
jgi:hypothetical protein